MNVEKLNKRVRKVESDISYQVSKLSEDFFNETSWNISSIKIDIVFKTELKHFNSKISTKVSV